MKSKFLHLLKHRPSIGSSRDKRRQDLRVCGVILMFALSAVVLLHPSAAVAAPWDDAGNKILEIFTGGLARTIAIIAVIACGIMAMVGKLSWSWAINIVIGLVLIFGAATIVDYFSSSMT